MIVAIHQPNFLPWLGFFYKMYKSDILVLLDNAQYNLNAMTNRNKIKTEQGPSWITVPVLTKERFGQKIKDVEINSTVNWRRKHLGGFDANYRKAPFFDAIFEAIKDIYNEEWEKLCLLNVRLLEWVLCEVYLRRDIVFASKLGVEGNSTELLINVVKKLGGSTYLSGFGGKRYQDEARFKQENIELRYTDFKHPSYSQRGKKFESKCSIIDLLFNYGKQSLDVIMSAGGKDV